METPIKIKHITWTLIVALVVFLGYKSIVFIDTTLDTYYRNIAKVEELETKLSIWETEFSGYCTDFYTKEKNVVRRLNPKEAKDRVERVYRQRKYGLYFLDFTFSWDKSTCEAN